MKSKVIATSAVLFAGMALNSFAVENSAKNVKNNNNHQLNSLNITNKFGNALSIFVGYDRGFNNFSKDKFTSRDYQNNALEAGLGYNLYYKLNNKVDLFTGLRAVGRFNFNDKKYALQSNGRSALKAIGDTSTNADGVTLYEVGADADGNPIRATEEQIIAHNEVYRYVLMDNMFLGSHVPGMIPAGDLSSGVVKDNFNFDTSNGHHRITNAVIDPYLITFEEVNRYIDYGLGGFTPTYQPPLIDGINGAINYQDDEMMNSFNEIRAAYEDAYDEGAGSFQIDNVTVIVNQGGDVDVDAVKTAMMITGARNDDRLILDVSLRGNTAGDDAGEDTDRNNNNRNNNTRTEYSYSFKEVAYFAVPFGARIKINKDLSVEPYALAGMNLARINIQNNFVDTTKNKVGATVGAGVNFNVWKERLFAGVEYRYSVNKYNGVKFETNNVGLKFGYKFNF